MLISSLSQNWREDQAGSKKSESHRFYGIQIDSHSFRQETLFIKQNTIVSQRETFSPVLIAQCHEQSVSFKRNSRGKNRKFQPDSCFKIKDAETSNKITGCFTPDISIFLRKQRVIFTSKSFNIKVVFNYYRDLACKNPKQIQVYH